MSGRLYAAGILLFVTLSVCAYWVGIRRGADITKFDSTVVRKPKLNLCHRNELLLEERVSDAALDRGIRPRPDRTA